MNKGIINSINFEKEDALTLDRLEDRLEFSFVHPGVLTEELASCDKICDKICDRICDKICGHVFGPVDPIEIA